MDKTYCADDLKRQPVVNDVTFVSQPASPSDLSNGITPAVLLKCKGIDDLASAVSPFSRIWRTWREGPQPPSTDDDTPEQRIFQSTEEVDINKASVDMNELIDLNRSININDSSCQSIERDNSGMSTAEQDLIEKARRVSCVFERRATINQFNFSDEKQDVSTSVVPSPEFIDKNQSFIDLNESDGNGNTICFHNQSNGTITDIIDPLLTNITSIRSPLSKNIGIVVPMQCEPTKEIDLQREIEVLRQKIKEKEELIKNNEVKSMKLKEECESLTVKNGDYEQRVKSMELLAEKKGKEFESLLTKVASKRVMLLSLIKEKGEIDAARNHGIAKHDSETSEINNALAQSEAAFADIHVLYEKSKTVMNHAKSNNTEREAAAKELSAVIEKIEAELIEIQDATELKKQESQRTIQELRATHAKEKERIAVKLRTTQLKEKLLTEKIEQKSRENDELAAILNDLSIIEK